MALMTLSRSIDPERGGRPRSRPSTALAIPFNVFFASSRTIMRFPYSFNALSSTIAVASCLFSLKLYGVFFSESFLKTPSESETHSLSLLCWLLLLCALISARRPAASGVGDAPGESSLVSSRGTICDACASLGRGEAAGTSPGRAA